MRPNRHRRTPGPRPSSSSNFYEPTQTHVVVETGSHGASRPRFFFVRDLTSPKTRAIVAPTLSTQRTGASCIPA
jgi:hypothetical protein